jgi:hypothetical protein
MTNEQSAAYVIGEAAVLTARVLGMHAENMHRAATGQAMAYGEGDFTKAIRESACHHNASIELFGNAHD